MNNLQQIRKSVLTKIKFYHYRLSLEIDWNINLKINY
jgi:hypothetical protein